MAEPSIAARISAAAGDAVALLELAIELARENAAAAATLAELQRAEEVRRQDQRDRKRRSRANTPVTAGHVTSRDSAGQSVTSRDVTTPPSPSPSLSSPTPLINPSSPPSPASSSSAPAVGSPELEAEQRLRARLDPAGDIVVQRFLGRAGSDMRRAAWVGRLGALMDAPPHFTAAELGEGLEALMTEPEESWKPSVLKAWVKRVRTDATRAAAAAPSPNGQAPSRNGQSPAASTDDDNAGAVFARLRALVQTTEPVPGQARRRFIRRTDVEALGERVLEAYDRIGGAERFTDPDEKVGFVLRDFTREYATIALSAGVAP